MPVSLTSENDLYFFDGNQFSRDLLKFLSLLLPVVVSVLVVLALVENRIDKDLKYKPKEGEHEPDIITDRTNQPTKYGRDHVTLGDDEMVSEARFDVLQDEAVRLIPGDKILIKFFLDAQCLDALDVYGIYVYLNEGNRCGFFRGTVDRTFKTTNVLIMLSETAKDLHYGFLIEAADSTAELHVAKQVKLISGMFTGDDNKVIRHSEFLERSNFAYVGKDTAISTADIQFTSRTRFRLRTSVTNSVMLQLRIPHRPLIDRITVKVFNNQGELKEKAMRMELKLKRKETVAISKEEE